jgi:hypothetical protein
MKRLILLCPLLLSMLFVHGQITFENMPLPGPQMDYTQTIDTGDYIITSWDWDQTKLYGRKNADSSYEGFTYSNIKDSITPGVANDRAAFPAIGYDGSAQYGVGHGTCSMYIDLFPGVKPTREAMVYYLYVTNATCAVLSMEHGDNTAKKFGGANGTDPDWFLLTIKGYHYAEGTEDSVLFYLADFRSDTALQDYIVKDWKEVDLSSMGRVDSLSFSLSSSDTGVNGMNTPAYFCVDKINVEYSGSIEDYYRNNVCTIYPDPVAPGGTIHVNINAAITKEKYAARVFNVDGETILKKEISANATLTLPDIFPGLYFMTIYDKQQHIIGKQKITVR